MVQRTPEGVTLNVLGDKELEKAEPTNFVSCVLFLLFVFSSSVVSRVGLFFFSLVFFFLCCFVTTLRAKRKSAGSC